MHYTDKNSQHNSITKASLDKFHLWTKWLWLLSPDAIKGKLTTTLGGWKMTLGEVLCHFRTSVN